MAHIVILGSGGFGLSLAKIEAQNCEHKVTVWSKFKDEISSIKLYGENLQKLPGIKIPKKISLTNNISCIKGCDILIFCIPSNFLRSVAELAASYVDDHMIVVNTGKGIEEGSLKLLSQVITDVIGEVKLVVLSGPSHAEELARSIPTTVVAASYDSYAAMYIQDQLCNSSIRIYLNNDVIGCELGGAMKNIIALCYGICEGLGFGDNTKAALMTRGIHEIARLGKAMGAKTVTFSGLTGIGDLIVTCTSIHSRNTRAGKLIGGGMLPQEAIKQVGTVEGYYCCRAAKELADKLGIDMPITAQLHKILFEGGKASEAIGALMSRPMIYEYECTKYAEL